MAGWHRVGSATSNSLRAKCPVWAASGQGLALQSWLISSSAVAEISRLKCNLAIAACAVFQGWREGHRGWLWYLHAPRPRTLPVNDMAPLKGDSVIWVMPTVSMWISTARQRSLEPRQMAYTLESGLAVPHPGRYPRRYWLETSLASAAAICASLPAMVSSPLA